MSAFYARVARPVLFAMDPETAHRATILALKHLPVPHASVVTSRLPVQAFGLTFSNPLGMAPGFDKGAEVPDALLRLGFGFVEIGTVTPRPQPGNPRPRLFRLLEDRAVVNRFGFNSEGLDVVAARLAARGKRPGIVGVNIGSNKETTDRAADYVACVEAIAALSDYVTVNISSPNTPGLRNLQQGDVLDELLARVMDARDAAVARMRKPLPLLVKIAPDLSLHELDDIVRVARARRVDGMIVSNTTIARPPTLRSKDAGETGGLSGVPLFEPSTRTLAATWLRVENQFPLIGVGGIDGPDRAFQKIAAGATLVQLYSAIVYKGSALVREILAGLEVRLAHAGHASVRDLVGTQAQDWATR